MRQSNKDDDYHNQRVALYAIVLGGASGIMLMAVYGNYIDRWVGWLVVAPALFLGGIYIKQRAIMSRPDQRIELSSYFKFMTHRWLAFAVPCALMFTMGFWFAVVIYRSISKN